MYPDLSYLFHDLFGTQTDNWLSIFKTFGFLLVLAILTAAWFLYIELKRKAVEGVFQPQKAKLIVGSPATTGELISNGVFGFLLGFKGGYLFSHFPEFQADPAGVLLSAKGNWILGIALAALFAGWKYWERQKQKLPKPVEKIVDIFPHDKVGDITVVAALSGILGAKIFAIFEDTESLSAFFRDPVSTFFSGSGLAIYGGLIGGYLGVSWYLRKLKIPFLEFVDAVAPALIIAYGVGRIGCQLSGDGDWGITAAAQPSWWFLPDWMWAYDYPQNVNNSGVTISGLCDNDCWQQVFGQNMSVEEKCAQCCGVRYCHQLDAPVYPTPFYETIMAFIIGGILWVLRKRLKITGMLFFVYVFFVGIERFFIEKIRVNPDIDLGFAQATQAEIISVIMMLLGIAGCWILWTRAKRRTT